MRKLILFANTSLAGVAELVRLGLVGEYRLEVQLWRSARASRCSTGSRSPVDLELVWSKIYTTGVVGVRHETAPSPEAIVRSRFVRD